MIKYEQEYIDYIVANGVGKNDHVASSPKSYISYLNSISEDIGDDISPMLLSDEADIVTISESLVGKKAIKTIKNYRSAMRLYVKMVQEKQFR
jgi:hypothetical protein